MVFQGQGLRPKTVLLQNTRTKLRRKSPIKVDIDPDKRKQYLSKKLHAIELSQKSIDELIKAMGQTGFQGKKLAEVVDVWEAMLKDPDVTIFFGYAGSMSTTGQWKIVKWLIEKGYVDVIVSTGANVSEDVLDAMGYGYYQGSHLVDDADLYKNAIDRFYDVYADELEYRKMEALIGKFLNTLQTDYPYSSAELLHKFGAYQAELGIESISTAAYRKRIPIFSPALADSGFGVAAYQFKHATGKHIILDQFKDFEQLGEIGKNAKETGVIYIGGGVPKDTIQLVTVIVDLAFGGEQAYPHKYAIQITTDSPQWGGLSGCTFEEAASWGKINPKATKATCYCDATIALPIVAHALLERFGGEPRKGPDLSWIFQKS